MFLRMAVKCSVEATLWSTLGEGKRMEVKLTYCPRSIFVRSLGEMFEYRGM